MILLAACNDNIKCNYQIVLSLIVEILVLNLIVDSSSRRADYPPPMALDLKVWCKKRDNGEMNRRKVSWFKNQNKRTMFIQVWILMLILIQIIQMQSDGQLVILLEISIWCNENQILTMMREKLRKFRKVDCKSRIQKI